MKFFDLFPTPRYLSLAEAGISISEKAIHFISFRHGKPGELKTETFGGLNLPDGTITSGVITDKDTLVSVLSKIRREMGFKYVALSIPEEKAYLFTASVEKVPYKDLSDTVPFIIEDNAPISLAEAVYSFEILPTQDKVQTAVSVLPREVVLAYEEAMKLAGFIPVSIDVEPQAVARALIREGDLRRHLLINIREQKTGLYLVENEVVQFSSTISLDLSLPEAVENLKSEIKKFFVFWKNKQTAESQDRGVIEHVIICGEGAQDEVMTSNIMSDVETSYGLANVWENVSSLDKRLPPMVFAESLSYAGAIGAALPQSKYLYV